jgi:hypothetical protein
MEPRFDLARLLGVVRSRSTSLPTAFHGEDHWRHLASIGLDLASKWLCMQKACYDQAMTTKKTDLQIRGMPVAIRDRLRRRADGKGLSMSQYVIELLKDDLARPSVAEWMSEVGKLPPIDLGGKTGADLVREGRRELGLDD